MHNCMILTNNISLFSILSTFFGTHLYFVTSPSLLFTPSQLFKNTILLKVMFEVWLRRKKKIIINIKGVKNIICVSFSCKIPEVMQYLKLLLKITYSITISLFPDLLSPYSSVPNLFICRKI